MTPDVKRMAGIVQGEIDRCSILQAKYFNGPISGKAIGALIGRDIEEAKRAILQKDLAAMHNALQALRDNF